MIEASISPRQPSAVTAEGPPTVKLWRERLGSFFNSTASEQITTVVEDHRLQDGPDGHMKRLRPDMIRRIDGVPKPVNPLVATSKGSVCWLSVLTTLMNTFIGDSCGACPILAWMLPCQLRLVRSSNSSYTQ